MSEGYPAHWRHATIHLNPQNGEMHSDGDHSVRVFIQDRMRGLEQENVALKKGAKRNALVSIATFILLLIVLLLTITR